jgi:cytidine deaminase
LTPIEDGDAAALIAAARAVREHAHAPYSSFKVGAAVQSATGRIYAGCNVENASYGATICAERSAVAALIAAGDRQLQAVAVYTESPDLTMPCGICRQVLYEFGSGAWVIVANANGSRRMPLAALLPEPFVLRR